MFISGLIYFDYLIYFVGDICFADFICFIYPNLFDGDIYLAEFV